MLIAFSLVPNDLNLLFSASEISNITPRVYHALSVSTNNYSLIDH